MNEICSIVSNSKVVRLPFYKRWLELLLIKNSRPTGLILAKLGKQIIHRPPDYIKIETTNACNGRCDYCPRDKMSRDIGTMSLDLFYKIIDETVEWKVRSIHLQNFGEPLLDPHIIDRVRYAKKKGVDYVSLFTNGMLLSDSVVDELTQAGLDEVNISIDPGDEKMHDSSRRNLSYDKIVSNLDNIIEFRKRKKLSYPKIILASIIHSANKTDVENFINRWGNLVEEIHFQKAHNWALKDSKDNNHRFSCFRLWLTFTILWDGSISLCCVDYDGKYMLGCVRESRLQEIWNNSEYRHIRLMHLNGTDAELDICRNCTLRLKDSPLWIKKILP